MGVFHQRFEALFPRVGALGCAVSFAPPLFLPVYLCTNVGSRGLLAAALPAQLHNLPRHWVHQPPLCCESSPPRLPVCAPPTSLDECFFFISLVVWLPYSLIFCQCWLVFFFKLLLSFLWLCVEVQCVYLRLHLGRNSFLFFKKKDFIYLFLETRERREKKRETSMCGCLSCSP